MYADLNAYDQAEGAYAEALEIRKRLAQTNPERYEPDVAMTQNNLGNMYCRPECLRQGGGGLRRSPGNQKAAGPDQSGAL
jgi:hypothetical protein